MDTLDELRVLDALRIGAAIFNTGSYHPAHDAWEALWLDLPEGTDRERLLHGLIQYTAATHHANTGNAVGAIGLAESALEYLAGLPATFESVCLPPVRVQLRAIAIDPNVLHRHDVPPLLVNRTALVCADLSPRHRRIAGAIIADHDRPDIGIDTAVLHAVEGDSPIGTLLEEYATKPRNRGIIGQRLREHLERETQRNADVSGLFDADDHSA